MNEVVRLSITEEHIRLNRLGRLWAFRDLRAKAQKIAAARLRVPVPRLVQVSVRHWREFGGQVIVIERTFGAIYHEFVKGGSCRWCPKPWRQHTEVERKRPG